MRKAKRILTSFLAIALVLSNLSLSTLTVNATEGTDEPIVEEQKETGSVSDNEIEIVSNNEPGSVSDNSLMPTSLEGEEEEVIEPQAGSEDDGEEGVPEVTHPIKTNVLNDFNTSFEGVDSSSGNLYWWNGQGSEGWDASLVKRTEYADGKPATDCGSYYAVVNPVSGSDKAIAQFGNNSVASALVAGTYKYAYWVKLEGDSAGNVSFIVQNGSNIVTGIPDKEVTLNSEEWQLVTGTFVIPGVGDAGYVKFEGTEGVTYCLDDLRVELVSGQEEKPETPVAPAGNVYKMSDLTLECSEDEVRVDENDDGSVSLTFNGKWKTVFIKIPSAISGYAIDKVTFNVTSDNASSFGYKTFTEKKTDGTCTDEKYEMPEIIPAKKTNSQLTYLGITSNHGSDEEIIMTISEISFETSEGAEDNTPEMDITYNFVDLVNLDYGWGSTGTIGKGGEIALNFSAQYGELKIPLPEGLDASKITNVKVNLTSGSEGGMAIKQYDTSAKELKANYGTLELSPVNGGFGSIGIMAKDGACSVKLSGITFTYKGEAEITKTYPLMDLYADKKNVEVTAKESDETVILDYEGLHKEIFFKMPKEIDSSKLHKVTFNVSSGNGSDLAYKFYTAENYSGDWPSSANERVSYGNPVAVIQSGFAGMEYFGVMSMVESTSVTIDSVTFHTTGWGYVEESKEEITYEDNIIVNPYFEENGELSVWEPGKGQSVITAEKSDSAIADTDITTYGKIARDVETATSGDGFYQDITDKVSAGEEYQVDFYAMLSDEYAGVAKELRTIEFAPYIVEEGVTKYLCGHYNTAQVSSGLQKSIEPGKWEHFSGTFNISANGNIDKVMIRIIEQGTEHGSGDCVKGDFYVTGVSLKKIIKPETTIEMDIPNWKDAITTAFGDDAIAGTCLGSGTINQKHLQELAKKHFNAITFENEMKPDATLKQNDDGTPVIADGYPVYNFTTADRMMKQIHDWNVANEGNFKVRGHVLVWHSQTPDWFFRVDYDTNKDYVDKNTMNARMEHYIKSVFEHYESVVYEDGSKASDLFYGWDVVNEAMSDNTGKPRMASESSSWARVYGDQSNEYIINAFRYANEHAPGHIELYYNDYNDCNEQKSNGIAQLVKDIKTAEGTRIDGVGMQAHHDFTSPSVSQIKSAINKYLDALGDGGTVQMTELDVKRSAFLDSATAIEAEHNKQAWRFKEIFNAYIDVEKARPGSVGGITMWGITDETSWLQDNNSVGGASSGGRQAPLLFYVDNYVAKAKPAFYAFFDEYEGTLAPMIQSVTVMQQMKADNFDIGRTYGVEGVFSFVPMWTNEGLTIKISVTDDTDNGANDKVTVYIDEANSKAEGNFAKVTVARNAAGVTSTASGYETIVTIPMATGSAKTFSMDVAVDNNGTVSVFNDKKGGQDSSSKYYADAIMKPYAEIKKGTVTVDGEADAAWANVDAIPLSIVNEKAEACATAKALWDTENLYVYVEVKDADLDATASADHEKDSVEVFIDENNAKAETYEDDDKQYRVNIENEQTFKGTKCIAENIKSVVVKTSDGYVLEAAYKWTDITPANGKEIGIEFQINDAKGGTRIGTVNWYDTSGQGYQYPSVLGTALLVDGTSTPDTPSEGGNTKPEGGSSSDSGSSSSGSSSSGSSSDKDSSSSEETTTPEETPTTPTTPATPSTPATPEAGDDADDTTVEEDTTSTLETLIPEAVETVVEQLQTLVDEDATFEEKVEAVQEVIDTVIEVVTNEEVQELAKEAISSIEQKIKDALGIDTEVECKGEDVPEVKSVIGALLSVDAGKQPKLKVEALEKDTTAEIAELDEGLVNGFPLDIKLLADGEEVQPNVPITIRMGIPKGIDKDKEIKVVHFGKNGKNMLDVALFGEEMEFTTDGFSTFVVVNVESATAGTEIAPADEAATEVADAEDVVSSAVEDKAEDNGFATFIIIVIVVALLALAAVGFYVFKNKKEE